MIDEKYYILQDSISMDDQYDRAMEFVSSGDTGAGFAARLVFEELFVNIMNYAYEKKEKSPVTVCMEKTEDGVFIIFVDFGVPFNPVERANWTASSGQIGGRGIDLVKAYSRQFEYQRVFGANVVRVLI